MIATGHASKKKWNKDLLRLLYMQGYEIPEICKLQAFEKLSPNYLQKMVYGEKWHIERKDLREKAKALGDIQVVDLFKVQTDKHYQFMVRELERHRELIAKRELKDSTQGQKADIELLKTYEDVARKVLGLDEVNQAKDRETAGQQALVMIHQNGPIFLQNNGGATMTLPSNQNDSTGILELKNDTLENVMEGDFSQSGDDSIEEYIPEFSQEHEKATEDIAPPVVWTVKGKKS